MKLIESKAEYIPQASGLDGLYKHIELCGRTCYKSTDKITEESAKPFVNKMIVSNHTAMLEQGTVYLFIPEKEYDKQLSLYSYGVKACERYGRIHFEEGGVYVTTNYRVIVEHNLYHLLDFICEPTEYHDKRYTFKFTCDRGVSHEIVRSRVMSFAQESTRYCNYSKDKFSGEITYIIPSWFKTFNVEGKYDGEIRDGSGRVVIGGNVIQTSIDDIKEHYLCSRLHEAESAYMWLLKNGCSPQEARQVLPNALKTEICVTGFASDWRFFFDLRLFAKTGNPHPDMLLLAERAKSVAEDAGIWDDIMKYPSKFD